MILHGYNGFNQCDNKEILLHKIDYIKSTNITTAYSKFTILFLSFNFVKPFYFLITTF